MAFDFLGTGLSAPGYGGGWFGGRGAGQSNVFDQIDPSAVALFAMADRLAQAGQPSPVKQSTFGAVASSFLPAALAYGAAGRSNRQAQFDELRLQDLQRQVDQRRRADETLRGIFGPGGNASAPTMPNGMPRPVAPQIERSTAGAAFEADAYARSGGRVGSPMPGTVTPNFGPGAQINPGDFPRAPAAPGQVTPYRGPGAQMDPVLRVPNGGGGFDYVNTGNSASGAAGMLAGLPPEVLAYARANPEFAQQLLAAASQRAFKTEDPIKLQAGDVLLDPRSRRPIYQAPSKPNELTGDLALIAAVYPPGSPEFMAEAKRALEAKRNGDNGQLLQVPDDLSPTGFRYVTRSQALGQPAIGPGGLQLEFGPDGKPTLIRSGPGGTSKPGNPAGLAQPTINTLEESAVTAGNALARLDQVSRGFKPEYQQWGTRGANWWNAVKEKAGADLPPADRQALTEFSQFRRDSVALLNQTIKDITGAAMSNAEAGRITAQVPNPGTGVFDGDSPTEFKAKLDGVTKDTRNALLRANWARARGLDPLKTGVELSEVPALINRRGDEIAAEVRSQNPQLDAQGVRQLVRQRLGREFGMLQ